MNRDAGIIDAMRRTETVSFPPLSPRMSYGRMRMALYDVAPELNVSSALLPGILDGIYCLETNTILIDRRIAYTRKTLHARARARPLEARRRHHKRLHGRQDGTPLPKGDRHTAHRPGGIRFGGTNVRCDPYQMAAELNVTVQIIEDYRALLYEHVR